MNKKSQAAITDLFVAIAIFVALITITTTMWSLYNSRLASRVAYDDMVVKTFQVSDVMLKTSGEPSNWETLDFSTQIDTIKYVGLVNNQRYIPYEKVNGLNSLFKEDADALKKMFNIGQYDFNFRILNSTGTEMYNFGDPAVSSKYVVNLARTIKFVDLDATPEAVTIEISLSR